MAKIPFDSLPAAMEAVAVKGMQALEKEVFGAAATIVGAIKNQVRRTFPEGRTGRLSESFRPQPMVNLPKDTVGVKIVSDLEYAGIQDRGGTIYPSTVTRLAVPVGIWRRKLPVGKWPRHFADGELHILPRPGKDPLLVRWGRKRVVRGTSKRGRPTRRVVRDIDPVFVLKKSVRIKGRHYIAEALREVEPEVVSLVGGITVETIDKELRRYTKKRGA